MEQGARPKITTQAIVEKLATENIQNGKIKSILKMTERYKIGSLNCQTLQKAHEIPELRAATEETGHDIICIQEHRCIHEETIIEDQSYGNLEIHQHGKTA